MNTDRAGLRSAIHVPAASNALQTRHFRCTGEQRPQLRRLVCHVTRPSHCADFNRDQHSSARSRAVGGVDTRVRKVGVDIE